MKNVLDRIQKVKMTVMRFRRVQDKPLFPLTRIVKGIYMPLDVINKLTLTVEAITYLKFCRKTTK